MSLYVRYQSKCSMAIDVGVECRFVIQLHVPLLSNRKKNISALTLHKFHNHTLYYTELYICIIVEFAK